MFGKDWVGLREVPAGVLYLATNLRDYETIRQKNRERKQRTALYSTSLVRPLAKACCLAMSSVGVSLKSWAAKRGAYLFSLMSDIVWRW
jgi:hypothetical protein